jgi:hypothetical protein
MGARIVKTGMGTYVRQPGSGKVTKTSHCLSTKGYSK